MSNDSIIPFLLLSLFVVAGIVMIFLSITKIKSGDLKTAIEILILGLCFAICGIMAMFLFQQNDNNHGTINETVPTIEERVETEIQDS